MWRSATLLVKIFLCLWLTACSAPQSWRWPASAQDDHPVAITNHGWHTGVVLRREDLGPTLSFVIRDLGSYPFYEFGWGDAAFYQANGVDSGLAMRALFWPTPSVMHVVAIPEAAKSYFANSEVAELHFSARGIRAIEQFVAGRFVGKTQEEIRPTRPGLYGHSRFYAAKGDYFFTYTCNSWTAEALAQGGAPMDGLPWRARGVMDEVARIRNLHR